MIDWWIKETSPCTKILSCYWVLGLIYNLIVGISIGNFLFLCLVGIIEIYFLSLLCQAVVRMFINEYSHASKRKIWLVSFTSCFCVCAILIISGKACSTTTEHDEKLDRYIEHMEPKW